MLITSVIPSLLCICFIALKLLIRQQEVRLVCKTTTCAAYAQRFCSGISERRKLWETANQGSPGK